MLFWGLRLATLVGATLQGSLFARPCGLTALVCGSAAPFRIARPILWVETHSKDAIASQYFYRMRGKTLIDLNLLALELAVFLCVYGLKVLTFGLFYWV